VARDDDVGHHGNWEPDENDNIHFGEEDLDAADPDVQYDLPIEDQDEEARLYGLRDVKYKSYRVDTGRSNKGRDPYDHVYANLPKKHHVLTRAKDCIHCGAKRIRGEGVAFCCRSGMVKIYTPEVPAEFKRLFTSQTDADAKYFRKNIRYFNSHFSFTSLGAKVDRRVATAAGTGVYTFRIQG
ncbi:hypothetical protein EJB05_09293, partial [Eragrostis curvula]